MRKAYKRKGSEEQQSETRQAEAVIGLRLDKVDWRLLRHLTLHEHAVSAFMQVYKITRNLAPEYNRDDFVELFWLKSEEILERIENGDSAKDDLPRLLRTLYYDS